MRSSPLMECDSDPIAKEKRRNEEKEVRERAEELEV